MTDQNEMRTIVDNTDSVAESMKMAMHQVASRRTFLRRAGVAGLAVPGMAAFLAACSKTKSKTTDGAASDAAPASDAAASQAPVTEAMAGTEAVTGTDAMVKTTEAAAGAKGGGIIKVAAQAPAKTLDPIAMADLGAYGVVAQCFEYLAGLADNGDIGPGLATEWTPNADSTEWTFKLREGVKWQSGGDFTADDVVATMERIVDKGDKLGGAIAAGSVTAKDPMTVVFKLAEPNASLPYLVSIYNPQSPITPKDYVAGTSLDAKPDGTGPWKLTKYDPTTGATFAANDAYWGGRPKLDGIDWQYFTDGASMVTAMQSGSVDALVQFSVVGGDALLNDPNFNTIKMRTATHREIWFNTAKGQFTDKRVRQAFALSIDRQALIDTLFKGNADIGNDHVIAPLYSFFSDKVPQRTRDVAKAKALLAEAGFKDGIKADLHAIDLGEVPQLAELLQAQVKEAGFDLTLAVESGTTFYDKQWCQSYPCAGSAELGIVDYGHRATPDVYLLKAFRSGGDWNSSQYKSPELDAAIKEYQASADLDKRKAASEKIETIMNEDVPACIPYFYNYLGGHSKKFTGVRLSALGQLLVDKASKV